MYPEYQKHSPAWLNRMIKMHNIWASYFADNENFDMANKCLWKIANYQNMLTASKSPIYKF